MTDWMDNSKSWAAKKVYYLTIYLNRHIKSRKIRWINTYMAINPFLINTIMSQNKDKRKKRKQFSSIVSPVMIGI